MGSVSLPFFTPINSAVCNMAEREAAVFGQLLVNLLASTRSFARKWNRTVCCSECSGSL